MTRGRYRWTLAVVAVSAFMITLDNTVVNVAMPTIKSTLHMSGSGVLWVATGYILMFSCLMIAGGRLTDVYGARLTFISGMSIFTGASLAAGLAHSESFLILSRVVQGSGAALALPATLVIVTVGRSDKQRSLGTMVWIAASSISLAAGPSVGGLITQHWGWNWIFLLNVVPGILVILLAMAVVNGKGDTSGARVDLPGVLVSATMLFAITYALSAAEQYGWSDPAVLSVLALAGIAGFSFVLVERWAPDPMIDLQFFRNRTFSGGFISQMLWGMGFNGVMFHGSILMQDFLGFSPPEAGLVFLPPSIALFVLTPLSFWLAGRVGSRLTIGGGMTLMAVGMALFGTLRQGDQYLDLMPGVMLVGMGSALTIPTAMYVLKSVPDKRVGVASGILNVIRELSGAFGIAVLGLLISSVEDRARQAGIATGEAMRQGASVAFFIGAALVLIGGVVSGLTLPRKAEAAAQTEQSTPAHKERPADRPVPVPEAEPALVPAGADPGYGAPHDPAHRRTFDPAYERTYEPGYERTYEPGYEPLYDPAADPNSTVPDLGRSPLPGRHHRPRHEPAYASGRTPGGVPATGHDYDGHGYEPRLGSGRFAEEPGLAALAARGSSPAGEGDDGLPWWHEEPAPRPVSNPYHSFDWYTPRNSKGQYEAR